MKNLDAIKAAWKIDERQYNEHFSKLISTQPKPGEEPSEEHREDIRLFWKFSAHLLNQYVRVYAQHGVYLEPMPFVQLARFAYHFEELGNGIVTDLFEFARSPGRPLRSIERKDISRAIFFLQAVESGEIVHRAPVKTVADCYNVTKQTVRNWRGRAEEICRGQPRPHVNVIEQSMRDSGSRYSVIGRGAPSDG